MRRYGLTLAPGQTVRDLPLLAVNGPLVAAAVENCGRKLFAALYYKHAGKALSGEGGLAVRWYTNLQVSADLIPRELAKVLNQVAEVKRGNVRLDDQFFYRWGVTDGGKAAGFLAFFLNSFAMLGYVHEKADPANFPDKAKILRPYDWAT